MYDIIFTREAQNDYEKAEPSLIRRLNRCFDQLATNPYNHPNIRPLRGPFSGYFRYRIGDWRVIYQVDETHQSITILLIAHRSKAYQ